MRKVVIASVMVASIALIASSSEAKPPRHGRSDSATPTESLDEKAKWATQDHYMERYVTAANVDCGITDKAKMIGYTFDKESFKGEDWAVHSPNGYCSSVFGQVSSICRNTPGGKEAVQAGLKSITCRYGGKGKFSTSMSKGNFTVAFDWDQVNMEDMVLQSLKKNL